MSGKLLWSGLTVIMAGQFYNLDPFVPKVGAVIMIVGVILMLMDK